MQVTINITTISNFMCTQIVWVQIKNESESQIEMERNKSKITHQFAGISHILFVYTRNYIQITTIYLSLQ